MNGVAEKNKVRVLMGQMLGGAIVGAIAVGGFLAFVGEPHMNLEDPAIMLTIVAGVSYMLIGLIVAAGLVAPKAGAHFLNVEDADEIREESPKLIPAAIVFLLTGLFLLLLASYGGETSMMSRGVVLTASAACLAGIIVAGWISSRSLDELTRQLGYETASATFQATMLLLCVWGALAHLDYVTWLSPLGLLSSVALLQLLASFVLVARKGMLMPR